MGVWGVFDEEIRPWEGMLSGLYSDEHVDMDGGYGVKYEHVAVPPSSCSRSPHGAAQPNTPR